MTRPVFFKKQFVNAKAILCCVSSVNTLHPDRTCCRASVQHLLYRGRLDASLWMASYFSLPITYRSSCKQALTLNHTFTWTASSPFADPNGMRPLSRSNFFHFHAVFGKKIAKQDSIPVGCVPPACQMYVFWWPPLVSIPMGKGRG